MLPLVSEKGKGKIKWKIIYRAAKWFSPNGRFRHDFYFVLVCICFSFCRKSLHALIAARTKLVIFPPEILLPTG